MPEKADGARVDKSDQIEEMQLESSSTLVDISDETDVNQSYVAATDATADTLWMSAFIDEDTADT